MKIPVIGTGLSGMVGTRVVELLKKDYEFTDLSYTTGVDITDIDQVIETFKVSNADTVIHMAAKTDVDACEDDKILGEEGQAWMVNVIGTQNIADAAKKTGKRVIYISTDFVFDGTADYYTEEDVPNPVNWYGVTKYEGEELIRKTGVSCCIVRLAYPYRASFSSKTDFVRKIIDMVHNGHDIISLTDHIFTPTFIDDFAAVLALLLERNMEGIFHAVGSQNLTPLESVKLIMKTFNIHGKIKQALRKDYFRFRAFRPCRLALKNDKITGLGIKMRRFDDGLQEMKKQLTSD